MKIIVYHSYYGCESQCCGHIIEIRDDNDEYLKHQFEFSHPNSSENYLDFAKQLVEETYGREHANDLVWEECEIIDDEHI